MPGHNYAKLMGVVRRVRRGDIPFGGSSDRVKQLAISAPIEDPAKRDVPKNDPSPDTKKSDS